MAFLKTWSLLPLAALLLLSIVPTVAKVVTSMSDCEGFLLNETPPNIPGILEKGNIQDQNRYKLICQTFEDTRRFVTLYNTENKIPVFSAYKYRGKSNIKRPTDIWKIEPQLEDPSDEENMVRDNGDTYTKQAGKSDYKNHTGFHKGHLYPSAYAFSEDDKESTCALTNTVPQVPRFNQGSWRTMETCTRCVLNQYCINNNGAVEAFLVTGAQPGTNTLNNRVNVPSLLWSAFCCYSSTEGKWLAAAFWGANSNETKSLQIKTLGDLQNELGSFSIVQIVQGVQVQVFPGSQCPLNTNVSQLYPKLTKTYQKRGYDCP